MQKQHYFCLGLCIISMSLVATPTITDFFFHRGLHQDRFVWYLSAACKPRIERVAVGAKERVTITVSPIGVHDAKLARRLKKVSYRHGAQVHCSYIDNVLKCSCVYRPSRLMFDVREMTNIRGLPMLSITLTRTDVAARRIPGSRTIVIDPGHGGDQIGGQGHGLKEKQSTLRIALMLKDCLKAKGYRVVMTRNCDKHVSLDERTSLANMQDASIFISLHHDFSTKDAMRRGVHVLYSNDNSVSLAKTVQSHLVRMNIDGTVIADLGIERKYPQVTYGAEMPAVLAEVFFLSNAADVALLQNRMVQKEIAQSLCDAVDSFCSRTMFG